MNFEEFKNLILYRKIVEWDSHYIILDNGMRITIEMTDNDCCAQASGEFKNVKLDAAITDVIEPQYAQWEDDDTYGCSAVVKMLHNQNLICEVNADADAGNGGYYYSIASFVVRYDDKRSNVYLVGSEEGR